MAAEKLTAPDKGLQIIHAGIFRTGTKSMAAAYRILGYQTHHGLDDLMYGNKWDLLEKAAEATWPGVGPIRPRFTRKDWDEIWGNDFDVATDLASSFVEQLIEAYPEAKVVIVQRDYDKWWPSFKSECLESTFNVWTRMAMAIVNPVLRIRAGYAMIKTHRGWFQAQTVQEMEAKSWGVYHEYYNNIRRMVPAERRLEYKLGDGWEPLCEFLGKDIPDAPFPRLNDREEHIAGTDRTTRIALAMTAMRILPVFALAIALYMGISALRRQGGLLP